jgi:hypothetical protein
MSVMTFANLLKLFSCPCNTSRFARSAAKSSIAAITMTGLSGHGGGEAGFLPDRERTDLFVCIPLPYLRSTHANADEAKRDFTLEEAAQFKLSGMPIQIDHVHASDATIGVVEAEIMKRASKWAIGRIYVDETVTEYGLWTARRIAAGIFRGVSIGHTVSKSEVGDAVMFTKGTLELSVCEEGRRLGSRIRQYFPSLYTLERLTNDELTKLAETYQYTLPPTNPVQSIFAQANERLLNPEYFSSRQYIPINYPMNTESINNPGSTSLANNAPTEDAMQVDEPAPSTPPPAQSSAPPAAAPPAAAPPAAAPPAAAPPASMEVDPAAQDNKRGQKRAKEDDLANAQHNVSEIIAAAQEREATARRLIEEQTARIQERDAKIAAFEKKEAEARENDIRRKREEYTKVENTMEELIGSLPPELLSRIKNQYGSLKGVADDHLAKGEYDKATQVMEASADLVSCASANYAEQQELRAQNEQRAMRKYMEDRPSYRIPASSLGYGARNASTSLASSSSSAAAAAASRKSPAAPAKFLSQVETKETRRLMQGVAPAETAATILSSAKGGAVPSYDDFANKMFGTLGVVNSSANGEQVEVPYAFDDQKMRPRPIEFGAAQWNHAHAQALSNRVWSIVTTSTDPVNTAEVYGNFPKHEVLAPFTGMNVRDIYGGAPMRAW